MPLKSLNRVSDKVKLKVGRKKGRSNNWIRGYEEIPEPENYDKLCRLIPFRYKELREYIKALKYDNKRMRLWYNRVVPRLIEDMKKADKENFILRKQLNMIILRVRLAIGDIETIYPPQKPKVRRAGNKEVDA
jgi:hypothetical protein